MNPLTAAFLNLRNQLSNFGLNPGEWSFEAMVQDFIQIRHLTDKDFCMSARVRQSHCGSLRIEDLSLISV